MRVAEFVEFEKFGRQRLATGMSLTFVLVDAYFEFSGHGKRSLWSRAALARAYGVPDCGIFWEQATWPRR
jgi:hypothetical protein